MKNCIKCKQNKDFDCFYKYKNGSFRGACKDCFKIYRQNNKNKYNKWKIGWRNKNRDKIRIQNAKLHKKYKNKLIEIVKNIKSRGCDICKKVTDPVAMDFDHIDPQKKKYEVSVLVMRGVSEKLLLKEIDKCQLLCVLCHRDKTFKEQRSRLPKILNRKQKRQEKLLNITFLAKNKPCEICGIQYNPWQMDFDHINPKTKAENISELRGRGSKESEIIKEILKCRILCACCHRIHSKRSISSS